MLYDFIRNTLNTEVEEGMDDCRSDCNCRSNRSSDICGDSDIKVFKEMK